MAQAPEGKILRIGIIQGGKIIREQLVRKREPITIGTAQNNTFTIPGAKALTPSFPLFNVKSNQYFLSFTDQMSGRVSVNENNIDFAAMVSQGLAQKEGNAYSLGLQEQSRGKIQIGDLTILFQFVTPPPEPPKPQIPPTAQNYWLKNIDQIYAGVMTGSFLLHVITIWYLETLPIPKGVKLEEIPDRFRAFLAPQKPPEAEPEPEKGPEETETQKDEKVEEAAEEEPQEQKASRTLSAAEQEARRQAIQSTGVLAVLTAQGNQGFGGALADVLAEGDTRGDLDNVLANVGGVGLASSADLKSTLGGGGGSAATIDSLGTGKVEQKGSALGRGGGGANISGSISVSKPVIEGDLDMSAVKRVFSQGARAVKSCYESELKRNPKLKGKVKVGITIGSTGAVAKVEIVQSTLGDSAVSDCVVSRIRRWRFPKPKGGEVYVEQTFVFTPAS